MSSNKPPPSIATVLSSATDSTPPPNLSNPTESKSFFQNLLQKPTSKNNESSSNQTITNNSILNLSLLRSISSYYHPAETSLATSEQCYLYLRAVSAHLPPSKPFLSQDMSALSEIVTACASCGSKLRNFRYYISPSGILSTLEEMLADVPICAAHSSFLQLYILSGQYELGMKFISKRGSFLGQSRQTTRQAARLVGINVEDLLSYLYYSGILYIGNQSWEKAIQCFQQCLVIPSQVVSFVQINAWKKWIMCQCSIDPTRDLDLNSLTCIFRGEISPCLLAFVGRSSTAADGGAAGSEELKSPEEMVGGGGPIRNLRATGNQRFQFHFGVDCYKNISTLFQASLINGQEPKFHAFVESKVELWERDGNLGLVKQISKRFLFEKIQRLAKVYQVLPFDKFYQKLGLLDSSTSCLENRIQDMEHILWNVLCQQQQNYRDHFQFVRVDQEEQIVYFVAGSSFEEEKSNEILTKCVLECIQLSNKVQNLDIGLTISPRYQSVLMKDGVGQQSSAGGGKRAAVASSMLGGVLGGLGPRGVAEFSERTGGG